MQRNHTHETTGKKVDAFMVDGIVFMGDLIEACNSYQEYFNFEDQPIPYIDYLLENYPAIYTFNNSKIINKNL